MITVVIPLFNAEKYISRSINSCINQSEVSQIIVIDDCSTDNSLGIVQELSALKDSEVLLLQNRINIGPGICRNKGIEVAKGDYIAFLDADDYYQAQRFTRALDRIKKDEEIDGIYSPLVLAVEEGVSITPDEDYRLEMTDGAQIGFEDALFKSRGTVSHCGILFRKSFLDEHDIRYAEGYWGEDTELLFKALQKGNIRYLDDPKTIRSITGQNLTTTLQAEEQYAFHKKWFYQMLESDYSKTVNFYFLKNYIRKHPFFHNRHTRIYRLPKFIAMVFKIITTPRLWSKLL
jgi:glycosyltransferase involved in cell wall biosynthesis